MLVENARTWVGTKFKHQGRIKKTSINEGGCDCLGLILGLGIKTKTGKLLEEFDPKNYPRLLKSNVLEERLNALLEQVNDIQIGDIILLRVNSWPQHLAIISETKPYITIIHSYIQAGKVVEQYFPEKWKDNISAIYRINKIQ